MQNHSEIAEFLWKIADLIKDDYDAKNYEDVILPFTLLRRLDCVLQPTRQAVREAAQKYKAIPEQRPVPDHFFPAEENAHAL
jgi:type I restriction enzyme M protein